MHKKLNKNLLIRFIFLFSFLSCLALAWWQIERMQWKAQLIETYQINSKKESYYPTDKINANDEFAHLKLKGKFDDNYYLMYAKNTYQQQFKQDIGYYVYSIFRYKYGNILINRGWVPQDEIKNLRKILSYPSEEIEVFILKEPKKQLIIPANDFKNKIITHVNLSEISKDAKIPLDKYFAIEQNNKQKLPLTIKSNIKFHDFHRGYAITWLIIAIAIAIIYYYKNKNNIN